jgi:hypothetical protein
MIAWVPSVIGLLMGLAIVVGNPVVGYIEFRKGQGYSSIPFIGGIALFGGVFLLPINTPLPRWIMASLAMCLDYTISLGIPFLAFVLIKDFAGSIGPKTG